jgi:LmbE family N-acetylglucosaminyl deacetylase
MLIVTDGSKGTWDPSIPGKKLAELRRREQKAAAGVIGATGEIVMLDHHDGELVYDMALREEMCLWIRRLRPEVVFSHDPWRRYMLHPDHRAAGWAAIDGVVSARDHLFFPSQPFDKHRPDAILLWSADSPDHWEDISTVIDQKIEALLCHSSQTISSMQGAASTEEGRQAFVERMKTWAAEQGAAAGLECAEAFKLIRP